jgi:glycosyltransferase involved in cell wall biosynthesis
VTKRIVFVVQTPEFGGAEKHLIDLVSRIEAPVQCQLLCFSEDFYSDALKDRPNVHVVKLPQIKTNKLWSFWKVFRRHRGDVIVLVKGVFDQYSLSAYVMARLSGVHRLIAIEHLIPDPLPGPAVGQGVLGSLRRLCGWRTRHFLTTSLQGYLCHVTVCVSEAIRQRLTHEYGYRADRTITIRNGVDLRLYTAARDDTKDLPKAPSRTPFRIVCAARLSRAKRIDLLLEALAELGKTHSGWHCVILGAGPLEKELRSYAQRLALEDCVTFAGHVADVRPYLQAADLFVLSSDKEGLPLALLEAMALGLPAVVTDVGGTGEVVIHRHNGLLVKPGSAEELASTMGYLLVHDEERRRMGNAARIRMQQHFDIEVSMNRLIHTVLGAAPSQSV